MTPEPPRVRRVPIRLAPSIHHGLEEQAAREGCSLAQYLREAGMMRWAWEVGFAEGETDPRLRPEVQAKLRELSVLLARQRRDVG